MQARNCLFVLFDVDVENLIQVGVHREGEDVAQMSYVREDRRENVRVSGDWPPRSDVFHSFTKLKIYSLLQRGECCLLYYLFIFMKRR